MEVFDMDDNTKVTSFGWMTDDQKPPHRCRSCGKNWVTREIVCSDCKPIYKYRRSDYYYHRTNEIQTLDMGVPLWL